MTSRIVRLVRSLDYRQRLLEGIDDIEREIIDYATKHNLRTIGGYRLDISAEPRHPAVPWLRRAIES
jgi:hypothetical protein